MSTSHDKGYLGEQTMGFVLGKHGYYFIDGPSGSGGHAITANGFDGAAYNPKTKHLIIYDNKAFTRAGNINSATAVDPERNLSNNLATLISKVKSIVLPDKADILKLLEQTKAAAQSGSGWPANAQIAVSKAYGNSKGITTKLAQKGISFIIV
jgi:hypothetical protein